MIGELRVDPEYNVPLAENKSRGSDGVEIRTAQAPGETALAP